MSPVFIITGPKGAGKTVLVNNLLNKLTLSVHHVQNAQHSLHNTFSNIQNLIASQEPIVICGELIPSEVLLLLQKVEDVKTYYGYLKVQEQDLLTKLEKLAETEIKGILKWTTKVEEQVRKTKQHKILDTTGKTETQIADEIATWINWYSPKLATITATD